MHFSIPETTEVKDVNQGNYTVYHLHADGILHCKLRFKQFNSLHELLKKQFGIYSLPYFPPKKFLSLKEVEIEERRALLEIYMQIISQDDRISNSSLFNDFLLNVQKETLENVIKEPIKLDILLADNSRINLQIMSTDNSSTVKETICREIKLPIKYTPYFSLFISREQEQANSNLANWSSKEALTTCTSKSHNPSFCFVENDKFINKTSIKIKSSNFKYVLIKKLMDFEAPFLTLKNANQNSDVHHIKLLKFYWNTDLDDKLIENDVALNLLYIQAVNDFERNLNEINKDHYQYLESLALRQSKKEYITFSKCVKNYGSVWFEQCVCDFPKPNTNCVILIKSNELILRTLLNNGNKFSSKDFILRITRIRCWRLTTGFNLQSPFKNHKKKPIFTNSFLKNSENNFKYELSIEYLISREDLKWIVIKSDQAVLMSTCLKSVIEELVLKKNNLPLYNEKSNEISVNLRKNSCNYYKSNDKSLNNNLGFPSPTKSMEKSLSVETFFAGYNKTKFNCNQAKNRKENSKVRSLVQNSAYDGIGDDDL